MRNLLSVLCLAIIGTGVSAVAHEHEEVSSLNYSIYQSYEYMKGVSGTKIAATQQLAKEQFYGWNATPDKLTGMFRDMYGPAMAVPGADNLQKAQALMAGKLVNMGIKSPEWIVTRNINAGHAAYVDFKQVVHGHEVVFSNLSFRFTTDSRLQRVKMKNFGTPEQDMQPVLSANDILNGNAMTAGMAGTSIDKKEITGDWVWFPIPKSSGYTIHPAWPFSMTGTGHNEMPFELTGYVDAITGELLYRSNSVNETFDVTVKANIHLATPVSPTTEVPVADMRVTIGGNNYITNDTGFVSVGTANAPVSVTYEVRGPWSVVRVGGNTPSFTANMATSPATYTLPIADTTTPQFRAVSAFYHVNKIHDYMKGHWPTFTTMDNNPLNTNVDISGNTCNAFYNNGNYSINFYAPQTSCRAYSMVSDIVYHEYGHGISYRFYSGNGTTFRNGAMGEANSDVWAMCINRDGVVGDGAYYNGGNIRSYLGAPKVYPNDLIGQVHNDGEIIAGAWWDVAVNTGSIDTMAKLFTLTHYDLPNGPNGTEGEVYHDVLISALMNDDDDANLGNGTPHFNDIIEAFARHGIYLLSDATVEHKEVAHQPNNTAVTINAKLILSNPAFFDKLYLVYRDRYGAGTWDSVAMTNVTGNDYTGQIPGFPGGSIVDYYFKAQDVVAVSSFGLPKGYNPSVSISELTLPYQYGVGIGYRRYTQDFEGNIDGWQLGEPTDNASGGLWVHETPIASYDDGEIIQPGTDNTTGSGKCLVTGNAASLAPASANDVDNGTTTVLTPYFDLHFYEPIIEYYRWYSADRGSSANMRSDYWTVELHPQNSVIWKRVDYTRESDQNWRRRIFRVSEYFAGVTTVQMRFVAEDRVLSGLQQSGQNVVEAAIDDFIIYEGSPLAINDKADVEARIYPNPADNMVNIEVPAGSKGSITLYDITGKTISKLEVTERTHKYSVNTSSVPAGTYLVLVQTQYAVQNNKVVISHN